jgi:hypothetical protein
MQLGSFISCLEHGRRHVGACGKNNQQEYVEQLVAHWIRVIAKSLPIVKPLHARPTLDPQARGFVHGARVP